MSYRTKSATPFILPNKVGGMLLPKFSKDSGGAGVLEIIEDDARGTYRAVYTVRFAGVVYVLHVFQKKSKKRNPDTQD